MADPVDQAKLAYETYASAVAWRDTQGMALPHYEDLDMPHKEAWDAVVAALTGATPEADDPPAQRKSRR